MLTDSEASHEVASSESSAWIRSSVRIDRSGELKCTEK